MRGESYRWAIRGLGLEIRGMILNCVREQGEWLWVLGWVIARIMGTGSRSLCSLCLSSSWSTITDTTTCDYSHQRPPQSSSNSDSVSPHSPSHSPSHLPTHRSLAQADTHGCQHTRDQNSYHRHCWGCNVARSLGRGCWDMNRSVMLLCPFFCGWIGGETDIM